MRLVESCKEELVTLRFEDYRYAVNCQAVPIIIEVRDRQGDLVFVRVNKQVLLDTLINDHDFLTKPKLIEQLKEFQEENNGI